MKMYKQKIFAYVDEFGQDTGGEIFIVTILILEKQKEAVEAKLKEIEFESGKKNVKWNKSRPNFRKKYIESIFNLKILEKNIFIDSFSDNKKYIELTSFATAKAILKKAGTNYKASVFIDGFRKKEIEIFRKTLRNLRVRTRKIRGVKKDENNIFVRLVDAICGLARDAKNENSWADKLLKRGIKRKIITKL